MKKALELNVPGNRKSPAPILVVHGTLDKVVSPEETKQLLPRSLRNGNSMKVSWYPDKDHRTVIAEAGKDILEWCDDRLKE
jgi:dipeptidyl aminopeptidase/acylaminoacyl peptidase